MSFTMTLVIQVIPCNTKLNKTVSLGDTAISLHTPAPTQVCCCFFLGGGGGYSGPTQIPSPSIWPSFHFRKGGPTQTWSSNISDNFHFLGGWGGGGNSGPTQAPSLSIWPNFHFLDQLKSQVSQSGQVFIFKAGRVLWTNSKPNSLNLAKFGGGWWVLWTKSNLKSQHLLQFSIPEWGHCGNFEPKIFTA